MVNPLERFTTRVDDYVRYRPSYPPAVVNLLQDRCGLTRDSVVADIGSGPGIFSRLLLDCVNRVYGVEPNSAMRQAAEEILAGFGNFHSVAGAAEATTLPDASVDFVTAAQAFHWFDRAQVRLEFARILKPGGWVVLLWNERHHASSGFALAYEEIVTRYGDEYREVRGRYLKPEQVAEFFASDPMQRAQFPNDHSVDLAGLIGRAASASYMPQPGKSNYEAMVRDLTEAFHRFSSADRVIFAYETDVYYGRLT